MTETTDHRLRHLEPIDFDSVDAGDLYDELPLWSAPFGMMVLERAPIRPGSRALDVGCGTGFLSIELAERCGPDATVYAIDPWRAAMERLRRKVVHRGLRNVVLLEQDAATVDLPDGSIDLIVSNLGINNFESPSTVLANCARMAATGATLVLSTNLVGHMHELYEAYRAVLADLRRPELVERLDQHIGARPTVDGLVSLLAGSSFEVRSVDTAAFRWRFATGSALLRHHFIRLGFVPGWLSVVQAEDQGAVFLALESRLNELADDLGEVALTIPMACIAAIRRDRRVLE